MNLRMKTTNYHSGCLNWCEAHTTAQLKQRGYFHFDGPVSCLRRQRRSGSSPLGLQSQGEWLSLYLAPVCNLDNQIIFAVS